MKPNRQSGAEKRRLKQLEAELQELRKQLTLERHERELLLHSTREAQGDLEQCRERYARLYDTAPTGFVTLDRAGVIREANLTAATMLGLARPRLPGMLLMRFVSREDRPKLLQHLRQCRQGSATGVVTEVRLGPPPRPALSVLLTSLPDQAPGQPAAQPRFRTALVDITQRKQAEEALRRLNATLEQRVARRTAELRESQERFRIIAASTPDHLIVQDRHLRYTLVVNPQLGLTEQEMLGKTDYDILLKAEADKLKHLKQQVMRTGRKIHVEMPATSTTGELEYFEGDYVPKYDHQGRIDGLIGYFRNVTARKRDEELLRANEQRLRMALKAASMVTWEWDIPTGTVRYSANTPEVVRGEALDPYSSIDAVIQQVHPDDRAALKQAIQRTISHGVAFECEYRVKMLDGAYRWISAKGDVVERRDGKPLRALGISQDITERKEAEQGLEQANTELRRLAHRLTQVEETERRRLAYVLHEGLQQLLVSALFQLSDVLSQTEDSTVRKKLTEATRILDESVSLTRTATYDVYPPALQELGLDAALGWLAEHSRKTLGLSVDLRVARAAQAEQEELRICLFRTAQELLLNVAKHAGVKNARVRLGGHAGREVWLEVSDAGAGFDPNAIAASNGKGTGFGLFSLRERAAMLGGGLELDSARGAGTRVRLWLPLLPQKAGTGSPGERPHRRR